MAYWTLVIALAAVLATAIWWFIQELSLDRPVEGISVAPNPQLSCAPPPLRLVVVKTIQGERNVSEGQVFPVPDAWAKRALMNAAGYEAACKRVDADPNGFWRDVASRLDWIKPFSVVKDVSFNAKDFHIRWFADGVLNVSANCLDRHLPHRANDVAIIWEGDDPANSRKITYAEAHAETCRMANVLKAKGVRRGDRVTIYMPMIPQAAYAMLACSRIGAVHSVIFGGFSPDSISGRIQDCQSRFVITADEGMRGGKVVPLKANVDEALEITCPDVCDVLVIRHYRRGREHAGRAEIIRTTDERAKVSLADCPPELHGARKTRAVHPPTPPDRPANPKAFCTPPAAI